MMSKKSPQLRFEGFADAWEERKLGNYIIQYSEKTKQNNQYPVFTSSRNGLFFQKDYYKGNQIASEDNTGYNIVPRGYFTYRHMSDDLVFKFNINDLADYGIVSTLYPVFTTNEQLDSKYLQYQLNEGSEFKRFSLLQKQGGSRTYMYLNKLQNMILTIPKLEEQQKIGSFFKQLDDTIALHQRKLDLLKEQKKGYLQKMFPKNGAKVPELRFAGFADDWEERKFKDNIVSIQTGTNLLGSTVNEGTPLIKMGNLQRGYFSFKKLEYLDSNSNVGSEDIVNYGDFLFNTRNTLELVGKGATWTGIGGKYAFNSNIARFKFDGIDTIFFNYLYNTQQVISQVHARAVGTTSVSAVYPRDLNSLLYYLPSIEEQQKIGSFFKQLDDTIALHQRKLDLLKEQKKGFLQKMFV